MSTEQSRADFEEWFRFHCDVGESELLLVRANGGMNYSYPKTDLMWIAWQASRAALVVELPDSFDVTMGAFGDAEVVTVVELKECLRAAGITVKE